MHFPIKDTNCMNHNCIEFVIGLRRKYLFLRATNYGPTHFFLNYGLILKKVDVLFPGFTC